ncbi:hypothetical protein [Bacteriovorax sp. Seq25_V]|uniref:hypothetical protein n=1 Tax=Bacteriovorax sp. Seq25_V TaxID=1201288 RepID=UPI00038A01ED|nr:hypothetical protein [Bacteriovorax sp. Seq25_V]EQC46640.1 hypothetical protein M900_2393 [Bacteriovorax sp. Seq25_V]
MAKYDKLKSMKFYKVMLHIIIFIQILTASEIMAEPGNIQDKIITDPSISRRCDELIEKRKQKINHRMRLTYILERSKKLRKDTPEPKVSIKEKLTETMLGIIKELKLTNLRIADLEENIIRRGCPGISL